MCCFCACSKHATMGIRRFSVSIQMSCRCLRCAMNTQYSVKHKGTWATYELGWNWTQDQVALSNCLVARWRLHECYHVSALWTSPDVFRASQFAPSYTCWLLILYHHSSRTISYIHDAIQRGGFQSRRQFMNGVAVFIQSERKIYSIKNAPN